MSAQSDLEAERANLQRKLRARDGQLGFEANVSAIKARLAAIEAELGALIE